MKMLDEILLYGVNTCPDHPAIVFQDTTWTYGALGAEVERLSAVLRARGLKAGDRIGLLMPNCPQFIIAYFAAARLRVVVVPSNPLLKPPELAYIWQDANVRLVVTISLIKPLVEAARQRVTQIESVLALDEITSNDLEGRPAESASPGEAVAEDDNACAVIIYTSGTMGHPKGAMLSHRNLVRNVEQIQAALHFDAQDRFLTVLPLFHAFAGTVCMNAALSAGSCTVLMETYSPGRALEALEKHALTIFCGVPAMFQALLMHKPERVYNLSALRMIVSGGAPLPEATLHALEQRFGLPVLEGDGPTECSPVTSVNPLEGLRKIGSVGLPVPGVEISIFDSEDRALPPNEVGEIVVRGDNVMLGYLNQPEATAEAMRSGWYHTGDLGRLDEDGYLFIVDRKKDMVITSGLNVYPREVEEVLMSHPDIAMAAVVGLQDALRGEEVVAILVRKPETNPASREVIAFCRERLANYKVPRRILFRETLPLGATGKVVKRLLKKELELGSETP